MGFIPKKGTAIAGVKEKMAYRSMLRRGRREDELTAENRLGSAIIVKNVLIIVEKRRLHHQLNQTAS